MAEQKILISININDKDATKGLSSVEAATKRLNKELSDEARELAVVNENLRIAKQRNKEYAKAQIQLSSTNDGFNNSLKGTSAALKQGRAQSGLNNAILLETGRLASDASYGFTAIANNLSQVVTLFSSFAKTNGGVIASFKTLTKSLIGSGGFLIAIQLIISFGPKIFAFFERLLGFTREMRDAFEGASKTVRDSAGSFEIYVRTLQDTTKSQKEQKDAIKALNEEFPDYVDQLKDAKLSLDDVAKQTEEATKITDLYREAIIKQAMSRQAQIKVEESAAKMVEIQVEREAEARDKGYESLEAAEKRLDELNAKREASKRKRLDADDVRESDRLKKIINLNQDELDEENKRIDSLLPFINIENKERKKVGKTREKLFNESKDFNIKELDFSKQIQKSQQKLRQSFIKDESFKINEIARAQKEVQALRRDDYIKQQEERKNNFIAAEKTRLDNFLAEEKDSAKRAAATKIYNDAAKQAEDEFLAAKSTAYDKYNVYVVEKDKETKKLLTDQSIKDTQELQAVNRQKLDAEAAYFDELDGISGNYSFFQSERNISNLQSDIAAQQAVVDSHAVGTIEREQAEARLYQLKSDLNVAEQADAEQKFAFFKEQYQAITGALSQTFEVSAENETIALEKSYSKRIAAAEGDAKTQERLQRQLEVKKDKIAKKAFERNKAVRIGEALMTVYQNGFLAYGSQLFPGDPISPVRATIQQAITIAAGLANVANIARQKYKSSVSSSGGGSSGSSAGARTIQAPDFNVVGASQTSQLAQTVAGAQSTPVKAFVVGKDVSTQQELDRNITNTASFG
jgi:hypothetical protein